VSGTTTRTSPISLTVTGPGPVTVFFDNFETSLGWTRNAGGTDTATTGLWERGDPETTTDSGTKQLGTTVSGLNDLVTGRLAGASAGVHDIDAGVTTIRSPAITLPATGTLTLSFSYYLAHGTNSSTADFLRVRVIGTTTTLVFEELGAANDDDAIWATFSANISAFAGQTVRIQIEAADASTASLVEAAVDDVRITRQ
jgi:aminopeptidase S